MIKNKRLMWGLFFLMALAQLALPVWMIYSKKTTGAKGIIYNFELQAIDPHDPFRGKYIILNPKENSFNLDSTAYGEHSVMFATFTNDSLGFARIKDLHISRPDGSNYLQVTTRNMARKEGKNPVRVIYPFERYYMNEYKAKAAEDLTRAVARDSIRTSYAEVAIYKGDATLLSLKVDGVPIEKVLQQ